MLTRRRPGRDRSSNDRCVWRAAKCALGGTVRAGAGDYDRMRDLPGLIRLDPFAPVPDTADAAKAIVARLQAALRAERNRARSGHWTYDLNRHIALRQAYLAETGRLAAIKAGRP
jgi:hypothetical protein